MVDAGLSGGGGADGDGDRRRRHYQPFRAPFYRIVAVMTAWTNE